MTNILRDKKIKLGVSAALLLSCSIILAGCNASGTNDNDTNDKQAQEVKVEVVNKEDLFGQVVETVEKTENLKMTVELDGKTRSQAKGPVGMDFNMSTGGIPYDISVVLEPLHYHIHSEIEGLRMELYGMEDYSYFTHPLISKDELYKVKAEEAGSLSALFDTNISFASDFYGGFNDRFSGLLDYMEMTTDDVGYSLILDATGLDSTVQYQLLKDREGFAVLDETEQVKENGLKVAALQYTFLIDKESFQLIGIGVEEDWSLETEDYVINTTESGIVTFSDFNNVSPIEVPDKDAEEIRFEDEDVENGFY